MSFGDNDPVYESILLIELKKAIASFDYNKLNLMNLSSLRNEVDIKLEKLTKNDRV